MADDCVLCDGCGEIETQDKRGQSVTAPCPTCVYDDLNDRFAGRIASLTSERDQLREALTKAAETFRVYQRLHLAKCNPEGDAKAKANRLTAEMCEAALGLGSATAVDGSGT